MKKLIAFVMLCMLGLSTFACGPSDAPQDVPDDPPETEEPLIPDMDDELQDILGD